MKGRLWWKHGVIYQIYPRSFMDANGDGIGDLEGIRRRLDHLAWLGIDGIWISPCFPSPMKDFGYDVADYCDIDPMFGDLDDFDRLLREAHARDIKIILDWVPNHTSDQHPWFLESRSRRESPKRDWYVWRDPKLDGSPPNNWQAIFGGPAWEWDSETGQYYLRSFLKEQPDLNWRNPELVAAMHDTLRFWLDRGVDGFRIDVIHKIAKDPELRDNPLHENGLPGYLGQVHENDEDHEDVHAMLREIRRVVDAYPERMTVGEVALSHPDPAVVARYYGRNDELHLAFNFSFMHQAWSAAGFREQIDRFLGLLPERCWPDWVLSNHDFSRHATRHDHPELGDSRARLAAMLLLTLRGTPFLYYGEEIGMRDGEIPEDRRQDPLAWTIHPKLSRDPERTPMQWTSEPGGGFSTGEPWLPLAGDHATRNVESQRWDSASLLHLYRDLLALRRATPALERGRFAWLESEGEVLAYERREGPSRALHRAQPGRRAGARPAPGRAGDRRRAHGLAQAASPSDRVRWSWRRPRASCWWSPSESPSASGASGPASARALARGPAGRRETARRGPMSPSRLWIPILVCLLAAPALAAPASWLRPKVDYVADTVMEVDGSAISGRVWASGSKERRELTVKGRRHVVIVRKDRGVSWVLMPEQRLYLETRPGEGAPGAEAFATSRLEREALGREQVNGASTTKYRVTGTTAKGTAFEGLMWMTDEEIPVRVLTGQGRERVRMELHDLSVGALDPRRFEIPPGYTRFELPAPAKADLEGLRGRSGR